MAIHEAQADGAPDADPKIPTTVRLLDEAAPDEITGQATGTDENLSALFDSTSGNHLADGFKGGSDDDVDVAVAGDVDPIAIPETEPELE
jgi:hypothetical protein